LDNVVGEQPKKVLGELGGFKRNGESAWGRKGKSKSKTHNVGAVAAAELVHAVRGRAGAADAPGVARVAGSADVAGLEEVVGALGRWVGECHGSGHQGQEWEAGEGELHFRVWFGGRVDYRSCRDCWIVWIWWQWEVMMM
jgi:hypothetical protein